MTLRIKQNELLESISLFFNSKGCYTCKFSFYSLENELKCNMKHIHLAKINCKDHKFKQ